MLFDYLNSMGDREVYLAMLLLFALLFILCAIQNNRETARRWKLANRKFKEIRVNATDPRYAFSGLTATILQEELESQSSRFEYETDALARKFAKNEYGEYFYVVVKRDDKHFVKHLNPRTARAILQSKLIEIETPA